MIASTEPIVNPAFPALVPVTDPSRPEDPLLRFADGLLHFWRTARRGRFPGSMTLTTPYLFGVALREKLRALGAKWRPIPQVWELIAHVGNVRVVMETLQAQGFVLTPDLAEELQRTWAIAHAHVGETSEARRARLAADEWPGG